MEPINDQIDDNFIILNDVIFDNCNYKKYENQSIDELKKIALSDDFCYGFSSDGFMKFFIDVNNLKSSVGDKIYIIRSKHTQFVNNSENPSLKRIGIIPEKIHFIWFSKGRPFNLMNYISISSAIYHHPNCKIYFHTDDQPKNNIYFETIKNKVIIEKLDVPEELNGHEIKYFQHKADICRVGILLREGGIYLDLDFILLKPLTDLMNNKFVMGYERPNSSNYMCNAVIMTEADSPFIADWLNIYKKSWGESFIPSSEWMGHSVIIPSMLNKKYHYMTSIQNYDAFYPFLWDDFSILADNDNNQTYENSYGFHLWDTELEKVKLAPIDVSYFRDSKIKNAFVRLCGKYVTDLPESEFIVFRNKDHFGDDIGHAGCWDIEGIKTKCLENPKCVGFNTLGYLKYYIGNQNDFKDFRVIQDGFYKGHCLFVHKKRYNHLHRFNPINKLQ
jgi:hypothetical protein